MGTAERRNEILKILCRRRHETIKKLAFELAVSERTIRRDIDVLSMSYPIYTQTGRYNGGIYVMEGFSMERIYMSDAELDVLKKLYKHTEQNPSVLNQNEKTTLYTIISTYTKQSNN